MVTGLTILVWSTDEKNTWINQPQKRSKVLFFIRLALCLRRFLVLKTHNKARTSVNAALSTKESVRGTKQDTELDKKKLNSSNSHEKALKILLHDFFLMVTFIS